MGVEVSEAGTEMHLWNFSKPGTEKMKVTLSALATGTR
jgi:hypothetical protein